MALWPPVPLPLAGLLAAALLQTNELERRVRDPDPDVRCRAADAARRAGTPEAARQIAPLLADDHPRVRARAAAALSAMPPRAGAALAELLHGSDSPPVRAGCARALRSHAEPLRAALDDPAPEVQAAAAESLVRMGEEVPDVEARFRRGDWRLRAALAPLVPGAVDDPDPRVRIAAAEARATSFDKLLGDPDWRLRSMGVAVARAARSAAAVDALVSRLPRERGRLAAEIVEALADLTGEAFGADAKAWARWWGRRRAQAGGFQCRPDAGAGGTQLESENTLFGQSVVSERVSFVIDLSGSMRGAKLEAVREELIRAVRRLPAEARFNIVLLGCEGDGSYDRARRVWAASLQPATEAAKARAVEFVRAQDARGWTNVYDALAAAFEDPDVDTVHLYSDGGASRGTFVMADEILEQMAAANRFRRIRIHTVQAASGETREWQTRLMKGLAEASGGRYLRK
jgi:hypothetical protein